MTAPATPPALIEVQASTAPAALQARAWAKAAEPLPRREPIALPEASALFDGARVNAAPGAVIPTSDPRVMMRLARPPKSGPVGLKRFNPVWWVKNDDDPEPPQWYRPGKSRLNRKTMWWFRNSFHNFDFYVIGLTDRTFTIKGRKPGTIGDRGWNWHVLRYKWVRLTFISYVRPGKTKTFNFYLGWRPGGCFGAKFNFHENKPKTKLKKEPK